MRKKRSWLTLLLLALLLLPGCKVSGNPLPEGMEEEAVLEQGREVVALLNAEEWQAVYDLLRADGQETTSPADIPSYMEALLAEAGAYQKETDQMTTGQKLKDSGEEYATAVFYVKHEKDDMLYRIAFSTELELIGFQVSVR